MKKGLCFLILSLVMAMSMISMSIANEEIAPRGEADCPYGTHQMVRSGSGHIYGSNGNLRYSNYAVYQCSYSRCGSWFLCAGDPANYGTIGNYFVNPAAESGGLGTFKFISDSSPSYKARTPLSGFEFYRTREAVAETE